ncbi:MAG: hypothetical protein ABSB29_06470 [Nitrososphaerales archaeon]|jgi:hypothetical protein
MTTSAKTVVICSSMEFIPEIRKWRALLNRLGYRVFTPHLVDHRKARKTYEEILALKQQDALRHFHRIRDANLVLVLNYDNHGIRNYVGGAVFAEIAVATFLKKPVYLVNPIPEGMPFTEELQAWKVMLWRKQRIKGEAGIE